ncbi:amidohydrolase [Pseudolabrys sp. Root1462]|uniref:M20 aminoacylase family protein n=1 Tax=Pseudolabrys sp. Root1462 TaxID=1736466 RepID=UPI000702AD1D|nr:M20 aminoacylase family protein [Pseudolabrys sp. Root1462]KQZ01106.1 amidohydrolase [Pseudolabrys sp. Root1462]
MPIVNRVADLHPEITAWRRDLHAHPELLYDVHRTAASVAEKLKAFGCDEVVPGLGLTGVVGVIRGRKQGSGKTIGLRADMDALPITELNDLPYKSTNPGKMHACGHDGHTAMLLGAARYLAETRNFDGTAVVIFQPAEEGGAGAKAMLDDGILTRFGIDEFYGMHNYPGMPVGQFGINSGAIMAATDTLQIDVEGLGGHAARPHLTVDAVLTAAQIINNIQSIVSRNVDPQHAAVVSICMVEAGNADNVLPETVRMRGTARSLDADVQDMLEKNLHRIVENTAAALGAKAKLTYNRNYPVLVNHDRETAFAAAVAKEIAGADRVDTAHPPMMGGEDFSFMLQKRPGAFIWVGNGDSAGLHHPRYNFNDDAIPLGTSYWVKLVETALPA